jgi:hypothetical protein
MWRGGLRPPVRQNNLGEITYLIKDGDPYGFGGAGYDRPYGKTTSVKSHTSSREAILTGSRSLPLYAALLEHPTF